MELFLLRHGIPVDPDRWPGTDAERPLTAAGIAQADAVVAKLIAMGEWAKDGEPGAFGAIWHSPYVRTTATAHIAGEALGLVPQPSPALASGADLLATLPRVHGTFERWPARLLCVGHQPDLGDLVTDLTDDVDRRYALGRAGVARLEGEFKRGGMQLVWLRTAEEILRG